MNRTVPPFAILAFIALVGSTATCGLDRFEVAPPGSPAWDVADGRGDAVAPDSGGDADDDVPVGDGGDEASVPDGSCPDSATLCGDVCVNLAVSREHCGRCDRSCGTHGDCINASCVCDTGHTFCPDGCVKLASDRDNCGACGVVCETGEACRGGECG